MTFDDSIALGLFLGGLAVVGYLSLRSAARKKREQGMTAQQDAPAPGRLPPVTVALIGLSIAVSLLSSLGSSLAELAPFLIAGPDSQGFQSIASGQIWRLVTPIFVHFGVFHLLFNMMWLWDLGAMAERRKGHLFILAFVMLVGIVSNLAQYLMTGSPFFGGMSGVVYGLLGYVWMAGRRNPQGGFSVSQQNAILMFGWFVLCWTGLLGPIANWAHTLGLALGVVWGYASTNRSDS